MGGLSNNTSNNILMLPKKCGYGKADSANQNIFQFLIKRKNTRRNSKNMQKNFWFGPPAMLANGAVGRDLIISLEQGSSFVQQLQPSGILRPFGQNAPAIAEGEAGFFVGQVAVRRCKATHKNKFLYSDFFQSVASDTKQSVFNPTLYTWSINK